ncbi:LPPG:FO 2-phospho-L-lactate transferase [Modestobacter sp. DSM 44400]|uniref:2-phospho-L-lactate transferase n=1 Tax=Modestobacter sp. DSM 44400 TaxID=1550230 RepID=UPI000897735D|nr:2-phospho-L-lactate transferase [Modestobacter sp. DSM 44400]SDX49026.1 LPPG:FO 2-phospho-L-lactate transferase [Modestobacter sp. DSM 44400]
MQIVVLAGGVGGARFLRGVLAAAPGADVTVVVNTGDDVTMHGLRICPDLDTVMYTLGNGIDEERGWGRRGESWTVKNELAAYGAEPTWFGLGDRDLATHLVRTRMLDAGYPLSEVTAALSTRWQPGVRLLPMSDQRVETHVVVADPETGRPQAIHFQEWWVRHRASLEASAFVQVGVDRARPAPGVVEALTGADAVLLAPSNPVVSIGTVLGVPGIREALRGTAGRVVGVSPIVGGEVVRGMADRCLPVVGVEVSAEGVGRHYGARSDGGLLDAWLVQTGDGASVPGVDVRPVPLLMSSPETTEALARAALDAAVEGPRPPHPSHAQGGPRDGAGGR